MEASSAVLHSGSARWTALRVGASVKAAALRHMVWALALVCVGLASARAQGPASAAPTPATAVALGTQSADDVSATGPATWKPVAVNAAEAINNGALFDAREGAFQLGEPGMGLVNSRAIWARFIVPSGGAQDAVPVLAAFDAESPDAAAPTLVRLVFSDEPQFAGALTIPLQVRHPSPWFEAKFGPQIVNITVRGRTVPVRINGEYYSDPAAPWLNPTGDGTEVWGWSGIKIGMAMEGRCRFGQKVYPVRIIDGNGNLAPDDTREDTLLLDIGDGDFAGDDLVRAYYGQPVRVDSRWYEMYLTKDHMPAAAVTMVVPMGHVRINHPRWSATLKSQNYTLRVAGSAEALEVPADTYELLGYAESLIVPAQATSAPSQAASAPGQVPGLARFVRADGRTFYGDQAEPVTVAVEAGRTVELRIGSPLRARMETFEMGSGRLRLVWRVSDVTGAPVQGMTLPGGPVPPAKFRILDAGRQVVHSGEMTPWTGLYATADWQMPAGLSGKLTIVPEPPAIPFDITVEETTVPGADGRW